MKKPTFFVLMFIGPSGVGKTTLSEMAGKAFALKVLDIGGVFRQEAYKAYRLKNPDAPPATPEILRSDLVSNLTQTAANAPDRVWWNQRKTQCREIADELGWRLIANGRDPEILLPNITTLIELQADPQTCTARREAQLGIGGGSTGSEMKKRDAADKARALPLPDDRIVIDTTGKTPEESFAEILRNLAERDIFTADAELCITTSRRIAIP